MRWLLLLVLVLVAVAAWALRAGDPAPPPGSGEVAGERADEARSDEHATPPVADRDGNPVAASSAGAPADTPGAEQPEPTADEQTDAEVEGLTFVVVDEREQAIERAFVTAFAGERDLAMARSDREGRVSLWAVPVDTAYRVTAHGYLPHVGRADPEREHQLVTMRAAPLLRGRVFAPGGGFVADARAVLLPPVEGRLTAPPVLPPDCHTSISDQRGEFVMPWPDHEAHDLVVTAKGFAPTVLPHIDARAQGEAVILVSLWPAARLEGHAVNAAGSALPSVLVQVWSVPKEPRSDRVLGTPQPWNGGHALRTVKTDHAGNFVCEDLPPGPAWVTFAGHVSGGARLVVLAAGSLRTLTIVAPTMASVVGHVAAAFGSEVFLRGDSVRSTAVDGGGNFRFERVPPGIYLIGLQKEPIAQHLHTVMQQFVIDGYSPHCLTIDLAPGERRQVDLAPSSAATGSVSGQAFVAGVPADGCTIAVESVLEVGSRRRQAAVDVDGSFRVTDVLPGNYVVRLLAVGDGRVLTELPCRVSAGDTLVITLVSR